MKIEKLLDQTVCASASTSSIKAQLISSLKTSKEYRHSFVEEKIRTGLATQTKAIREHRDGGMTQKQFAEMLGKSQSWVARLEDPNAAPPTLSTLLQVAYVFDVNLEVRFAPFSELVDWISGNPHLVPGLSSETLDVEDFEHDHGLVMGSQERTDEDYLPLRSLSEALESELSTQNLAREKSEQTGIGSGQESERRQQLGQDLLAQRGVAA